MDHSKSKFSPPKKRPKPSNMTTKLHNLCRKIVRRRDKSCVICGSTEALEVSHYMGRANMGVAWDLRNCNLMCKVCHSKFHHGSPKYMEWMRSTHGDSIFEELYDQQTEWIRSGGASMAAKEQIYDDLMEIWEEMGD